MSKRYNYDYSRLKDRIAKKYGTLTKFSAAMDCNVSTMSMRLTNRAEWPQGDIIKAKELLRISNRDIGAFFYTTKVQKD